jgi:hypothetical protein
MGDSPVRCVRGTRLEGVTTLALEATVELGDEGRLGFVTAGELASLTVADINLNRQPLSLGLSAVKVRDVVTPKLGHRRIESPFHDGLPGLGVDARKPLAAPGNVEAETPDGLAVPVVGLEVVYSPEPRPRYFVPPDEDVVVQGEVVGSLPAPVGCLGSSQSPTQLVLSGLSCDALLEGPSELLERAVALLA